MEMQLEVQNSDNIELLLFVQECQDYHQAKDGDGWVEQSGQSFFFGIFRSYLSCAHFSYNATCYYVATHLHYGHGAVPSLVMGTPNNDTAML
jgi:hypothetical protein